MKTLKISSKLLIPSVLLVGSCKKDNANRINETQQPQYVNLILKFFKGSIKSQWGKLGFLSLNGHSGLPYLTGEPTLAFTISNQLTGSINGVWLTEDKDAWIQIFKENGFLWGKIIWVADNANKNKLGLVILSNFKGSGNLLKGTIIEPRHNHTVSGTIQLSPDGRFLTVTGAAFGGLFSNSQVWTRVL